MSILIVVFFKIVPISSTTRPNKKLPSRKGSFSIGEWEVRTNLGKVVK